MNGQLHAWLRTLAVIASIATSAVVAGMHFEHRLTVIEDKNAAIVDRIQSLEQKLPCR